MQSVEGASSHSPLLNSLNNHSHLFDFNISIYYFNVRSIHPKLEDQHGLVEVHSPSIICIVESWLSEDISFPFKGFT